MIRHILSIVIFGLFGVSAPAWAAPANCDAEQAVREYYGGPEIRNLKIESLGNGLYSIDYDDLDGPAHCSGGQAEVNDACEVRPVRALFCE